VPLGKYALRSVGTLLFRYKQAPRRACEGPKPPRVLTDEAFEQLSLACTTKMGSKKNFT
jgi:hypothetical protein